MGCYFNLLNRKEFVEAYVNHAFNTSVASVFEDFRRGFFQVCDQNLVRLFRPKELQEILVGKDFHDWEKLKQVTLYSEAFSLYLYGLVLITAVLKPEPSWFLEHKI